MAKHKLSITFAGISAHFRETVPGLPHRAVLPDASALHFGHLGLGPDGDVTPYYLMPHFGVVLAKTPREQKRLTVNGVMDEGVLLTGARLQVVNAVDDTMTYDLSYGETPSLRQYVTRFDYSQDVVFGGRAACYFDLFGGTVTSNVVKGGARQVAFAVETDGPPRLQVTPLNTADTSTRSGIITLDGESLTVANMEIDPAEADTSFDFLLQYLTAQRGIPQILSRPTPGMGKLQGKRSVRDLTTALRSFAGVMSLGRPSPKDLERLIPDELTPSCSNSQYP